MKELLLLLALISPSFAQLPNIDYAGAFFATQVVTTNNGPIRKVGTLPATCTAVGGASSSNAVLYQGRVYQCTSTNTWTFAVGQTAALTSGRVPFATTGGLLADSANLTWNNSTNRLAVGGSAAPADTLDVQGGNIVLDNTRGVRARNSVGTSIDLFSFSSSNIMFIMGGASYNVVFAGGGKVGIGNTIAPSAALDIVPHSSSTIGTIIKGANSQTANLIETQNDSGTFLSGFDASGRLRYSTGLTQTTVGAAGGGSALPATPTGYIKINVNGAEVVVPYYPAS